MSGGSLPKPASILQMNNNACSTHTHTSHICEQSKGYTRNERRFLPRHGELKWGSEGDAGCGASPSAVGTPTASPSRCAWPRRRQPPRLVASHGRGRTRAASLGRAGHAPRPGWQLGLGRRPVVGLVFQSRDATGAVSDSIRRRK
jgi:hypothetical protein